MLSVLYMLNEKILLRLLLSNHWNLTTAIMRYQNAENVQFYRRDSRSVENGQQRLEKKSNPKIKYYEVKYHCINGGKKHISKATGAREVRYVVYQTVTILLDRFRYH